MRGLTQEKLRQKPVTCNRKTSRSGPKCPTHGRAGDFDAASRGPARSDAYTSKRFCAKRAAHTPAGVRDQANGAGFCRSMGYADVRLRDNRYNVRVLERVVQHIFVAAPTTLDCVARLRSLAGTRPLDPPVEHAWRNRTARRTSTGRSRHARRVRDAPRQLRDTPNRGPRP